MIKYGSPPHDLGKFDIRQKEMMLYLYLPILLDGKFAIPERLSPYRGMISACWIDFQKTTKIKDAHDILGVIGYITAKTMFVSKCSLGNRPGWHVDGFGSEGDLNYIWSNKNPTQFSVQEFLNISHDDQTSLMQFEDQASEGSIKTYPNKHLLRLDEGVVHRVNPDADEGVRSFVKVSFSKHKFNNEGNSHNHLFRYKWDMNPRHPLRNIDSETHNQQAGNS